MESNQTVIRLSHFKLIYRLVLSELIFVLIYAIARSVYFLVDPSVPYVSEVLFFFFLLISVLNTLVLVQVIVRWMNNYFVIRPGQVIFYSGIFNVKESVYRIEKNEQITLEQSFLGRLLDFGTLRIYNPALKDDLILGETQSPQKYKLIIEDMTGNNPSSFITLRK